MAISDLTNTTWLMNETVDADSLFWGGKTGWEITGETDSPDGTSFYYSINGFACMDESSPRQDWYAIYFVSQEYSLDYVWYMGDDTASLTMDSVDYQYIRITGGTDATNATLIAWFEANATQIGPEPPTPTTVQNLYFGSAKMVDSYWGTDSVSKMYWGDTLVWEKASSGYSVTIYNNTGLDNVNIYDGQDNTGTLLGTILIGDSETYTVSSGYLYAEWDDQFITDDITFAESGSDIGNPIQVTSNMSIEVWNVEPAVPYLTFSSPNSFTLNVVDNTKYWDGTIQYSTNTTTWNTWSGTSAISSGVSGNNNVLYLRGTGNTYITGSSASSSTRHWVLTGSNISCSGNIENLLDYATVANGNHPTMANYCYYYVFYGCTSLISAPGLPATTLTDYCYGYMFRGCTSLTTAPSLPATTLFNYCYYQMFVGCTSLTTPPALPATTLATYCYREMFRDCTSLTTAPSLPATTLTTYCYYGMFQKCTSLTTPPSLPATTLANNCYQQMFSNCTSLTTIPSLPTTTLTSRCYYAMFSSCTNIKLSTTQTGEYQTAYRIPTSGTGTTASYALNNMFTSTGGTFTGTATINTTYYTSNMVV